MMRVAVLGDIGSGKSHVARLFGCPVFDADNEVAKLYKKSKKCYNELKKKLPEYIFSFPVKKSELYNAIIANHHNLKKIIKIVHPEVRSSMNSFIKKNKDKKFIVLDITLLMENKINKKNDIFVFEDEKKKEINKIIKKRHNFNLEVDKKLKKLQLSVEVKKKHADYIIKNNFSNNSAKKSVKKILEKILFDA